MFPKAFLSDDFIKSYSNKIKNILGGHETIFGFPKDISPNIPRLIISGESSNFILTYNRIDLNIENTTLSKSFEKNTLEKIQEIFYVTNKEKNILMDKIGIVYNFILDEKDTSLLWKYLISEDANKFAEIQKEKSLRIVTEKTETDKTKNRTQHLLFSEYIIDNGNTELLISIDINNIHKTSSINSLEKLDSFIKTTKKDVSFLRKVVSSLYKEK